MIRTNYIQLYERQTAADGTAYDTADQLVEEQTKTTGEARESDPLGQGASARDTIVATPS